MLGDMQKQSFCDHTTFSFVSTKNQRLFSGGKMEIVEKKLGKRRVAYIKYKGSYEEVPVLLGEVWDL